MAFYVSSLLFCEVILGVIITIAGNEQVTGDVSSSSHWRQSPSAPVSFRQSSLVPATFKNTKRLRHSRHLAARPGHNPSDVFSLDGYDTNTYGIGDSSFAQLAAKEQYNHKPVFTNCSRYAPLVEEDQPIGTYVLQVTATDPDPIDNGGKVTYSFVTGESRKFKIDPDTGEITTAHVFDRDEPKREKEVYVIVRATDNGRPTLDAVCSFKVTIEDINDNFPIFDKTKYEESVSQDLAVNREVIRVSATDIDDGNNSKILYEINATRPQDNGYFHIDKYTGIIYLDKKIDRDPGYQFSFKLVATDQGVVPTSNPTTLTIVVVESHKKAPSFTSVPSSPIRIKEKFSDFSYRIATITAISNTDEKAPLFELVTGRTEQTNSLGTFTLTSEGTTAYIQLARPLDYEMISEYLLNVRVQNKYKLAASTTIIIKVEDENDHIPQFTEVVFGSVLENEPPGTPVMQVRAIDTDSSPEFNTVTYELADNQEYFAIDRITGNITTLVSFDREKQDVYNVKVIATDSSPSALYGKNSTRHNQAEQVFRIEIVDKNDHPPRFTRPEYIADNISEDVNINSLVIEVKAIDNDTASPVSYSIVEGNIDNVFMIESATGKIRVNGILDYEKITNYTLKVRAFDGLYEDYCKVEVKITNVNDVPPQFLPHQNTATIQEETLEPGCLFKVEAYDPDIKDQNAPQHIVYSVLDNDQHSPFLKVDHDGCVSLIRKLDRDPPKGFSRWQALIKANDEDQGPNSQYNTTEVNIELIDINDNAPFLKMPRPVVWRENQEPGTVTTLIAEDNDTPSNGPPFKFSIAPSSSIEIKSKFNVQGSELIALQKFDREDKKFYLVPISISDSGSPSMTGTSTLTVTIGDENDNPMKKGSSSVFIYNYKGELGDTEIGRVYVEDPDDWDLPDKNFLWADVTPHPNFDLNSGTGMITMLPDTPDDTYTLKFTVWEEAKLIPKHSVPAVVNVTVKVIPEEAVDKSGSIRIMDITAEEFITPDAHGFSKQDILRKKLSVMLNTSLENVDVFTVLHSPHNTNPKQLDVRFSAHGSPYYAAERINAAITSHKSELERELGLKMLMININECLIEKSVCTSSSCVNLLNKSNVSSAVYTNTTSFIGVRAVVDPVCQCDLQYKIVCLNGGTPVSNSKCECMEGFTGPRCELVSIGFTGNGWALYPPIEACEGRLSLEVRSNKPDGLVFYIGPTSPDNLLGVQDFMSLELKDGYPLLLVDYGSGTVRINHTEIRVADGNVHKIDIILTKANIELQVDNCKLASCLNLKTPVGSNEVLNVNGPLQVGGAHIDLGAVASGMNWTYRPWNTGFSGCIQNLTFNEKYYNLGMPSISKNADLNCNAGMAIAYSFGIDSSFLVAILICIAILIILLLAVVVHRRKTDDIYKDNDDIRENIINYEDEGGGEGDMTGYDLNVLRLIYDDPVHDKETPANARLIQRAGPDEVPDICGFLDGKKQTVDNDPETNPFDDVRHYAYEGDGNTTGSLSSLASGTDEGDLNFDYLSNFGPRFRKLADMYGEDPSDEDEDNYHNAASESWC